MWETVLGFFANFKSVLSSFTIFDFLDICLIAIILYNVIKFIRQTRAMQLVKGFVLLAVAYVAFDLLNMQATTYIMSRLFSDVVLVLIFVFQPEIRHALESVGRSKISRSGIFSTRGITTDDLEYRDSIEAICRACSNMSDKKIGALIVCEKETMLGEITATGSKLDALVTTEMIENIFYPKAPLHDGAAVISGDRITAAGCILPLTDNSLSSELGTRHRAAVGMSEKSDAIVVVVSEETGAISVATGGTLNRGISDGALREKLLNYLLSDPNKSEQSFFKRVFSSKKSDKSEK